MKTIITVIRKELIDTLRDRRTLLSAVVLPAVAIPLLLLVVAKIQTVIAEKDARKALTVGLVDTPDAFQQLMEQDSSFTLTFVDEAAGQRAVADDSLDALIAFAPDFTDQLGQMKPGTVRWYFKSTNAQVQSRLSVPLEQYRDRLTEQRLAQLTIRAETLTPLEVIEQDVASEREQMGQLVGGFLPYLFIILCFTGCMYPALDIISGEKERGTLETLLTAPSDRLSILVGKMLTIALMGLVSALIAVGGMAIGVHFLPQIPAAFLTMINGVLSASFITTLVLMLLPLTLFFAGLLTAIVVRAKSFKEAQSYATPVSFLVIMPAALAIAPGIALDGQTVWIPILNVALATKAAVAGTLAPVQLATIVFSLTLLAFGAVVISIRQFSREQTVLR